MAKQVVGSYILRNGELKVWFDDGTIKYFHSEKELEEYQELERENEQ